MYNSVKEDIFAKTLIKTFMKKILLLAGCSLLLGGCLSVNQNEQEKKCMKKSIYFDLMEKTLGAYSNEHIERYFDDVKQKGLTEHGFPRLTANIGVLIADGRRLDLFPIFLEMMEFCCRTIPTVKAVGVASPNEHGQAITSTETARDTAWSASTPKRKHRPNVKSAIASTDGTKTAEILSASR